MLFNNRHIREEKSGGPKCVELQQVRVKYVHVSVNVLFLHSTNITPISQWLFQLKNFNTDLRQITWKKDRNTGLSLRSINIPIHDI